MRAQVAEAVSQGARTHIDNFPDRSGSPYLGPQILTEVNHAMRIMREETFGPAVGIMPVDSDEEAIARLTQIKGIGRWSAEIYLLFAEGRPDIWPAGDLAVQAGLHKLLDLPERPSEKATRELAEAWRPHRGAAAIFTWHCYNNPAL